MAAGALMKTGGGIVTGFVLLLAAGCQNAESDSQETGAVQRPRTVTGTVRYLDLEGGFYGIEADHGTKLDPVNLPEDFRQDGVRVAVRVEELKDRVSTHMWGTLVRIMEIKRLPPGEGTTK